MMSLKDVEKFKKLMMLSTSDQDGEALSALRKAQFLMARANHTWEELIDGRVQAIQDNKHEDEELDEDELMTSLAKTNGETAARLHELLVRVHGSFRNFLISVANQYINRGTLSDKQMEAIDKAFSRLR